MVKAMDAPHHCPVCDELYYPRHSVRLGVGHVPMLVRVDDRVCIKGTDDWTRAYYHHSAIESGEPFEPNEAAAPI